MQVFAASNDSTESVDPNVTELPRTNVLEGNPDSSSTAKGQLMTPNERVVVGTLRVILNALVESPVTMPLFVKIFVPVPNTTVVLSGAIVIVLPVSMMKDDAPE